jgi:putative acetyltransferase
MTTELVQLGSFYGPPGLLLLARVDSRPVGCVGLRAMADGAGEIRRMYVELNQRGTGLGRRLLERLLAEANHAGLERVVLNKVATMVEAGGLYRSMGFEPVPRYHLTSTPGIRYLGRPVASMPQSRAGSIRHSSSAPKVDEL